jgi:hypothetical protein
MFIKSINVWEKDPADDLSFKIEHFAKLDGIQLFFKGELIELPVLSPIDEWEKFLDFDRNAIKLGYKEFVRPTMKSDGNLFFPYLYVRVAGNVNTRTRVPLVKDQRRSKRMKKKIFRTP